MTDAFNEISSQIGALAVRVDARDWQGLVGLFDAQVHVDDTSLFGGEVQTLSGEELVGSWRRLVSGFTHTSHVIGVPTITERGEHAEAAASVTAWHAIDDQAVEGVGSVSQEFQWIARTWPDGNEVEV